MSFKPEKPADWLFYDAVEDFVGRNQRFLFGDSRHTVFPNDSVAVPKSPISILGSDEVLLRSVARGGDSNGFSMVYLELFEDGSPHIPEADVAQDVESNEYVICAGREVLPFAFAADILEEYQGWTGKYVEEHQPLPHLSADQCAEVLGYLAQVETLLQESIKNK